MKVWIVTLLVCIVFTCIGCAMSMTQYTAAPQTQSTPSVAEESSIPALPKSYMPAGQNENEMRLVKQAFQTEPSLNSLSSFVALRNMHISEKARFSGVVISGCDLDIIKGLVASNLVPVVIIKSPVGQNHSRVITGYDDSTERLSCIDPLGSGQMGMSYPDFTRSWIDPQKTCLLLFSQSIDAESIKNRLRTCLPREKVDSIFIKTK